MKKNLIILGAVSLATVATIGTLALKRTPSFVHATDNLNIKLTYENVRNVSYDEYYGHSFDLVKTTTFGNEYKIEGANVYASGTANIYSTSNQHSDGRILDYVTGGYGSFQISGQYYDNVSIKGVELLVSLDGGEKQTINWGYQNDTETHYWSIYFDNFCNNGESPHNSIALYEINISYNCLIM